MKSWRDRINPAQWSTSLVFALALAVVADGLFSLGHSAEGAFAPQDAVPTAGSAPAPTSAARVPSLFQKSRTFRIPFNIAPADRPKLKEIQLWASDDSGFDWKLVSRTTPERRVFTFRATHDGEFWFAVRTLDKQGVLVPSEEMKVEPSMKVIVDTTKPTVLLYADGRRGPLTAVRWEVKDDHLDLRTLAVDYQRNGDQDWRQVPVRRANQTYIGGETWDAGTAEPLRVRVSISDLAGNLAETVIDVADGSPANPTLTSTNNNDEYGNVPAPVSPVSNPISALPSNTTDENAGASPGVGEMYPKLNEPPRSPDPSLNEFFGPGSGRQPQGQVQEPQAQPPFRTVPPQALVVNSAPTAGAADGNEPDPFGGPAVTGGGGAGPASPVAIDGGAGQTLLVSNPNCAIQYAVDDAGPAGPAIVELWVSPDAGRNWIRKGEDPDRTSPFQVDLGGDGTFGLRLVARGASGLGDQPPAPGDVPHLWVEVDRTPPTLQMIKPVVGTGPNLGKVAIRWRASDLHLAPKPVTIYWRPDQSGSAWQAITEQAIDNTGTFIWTVPTTIPPKFHLKVAAVDTVGNTGAVETNEGEAVIVDRTRPRSRITGLAPSAAQAGGGTIR